MRLFAECGEQSILAATCEKSAEYDYSCTCGEVGEVTFLSGQALPHDYTVKVEVSLTVNTTYFYRAYDKHEGRCLGCHGEILRRESRANLPRMGD